MHNSCKKHVQSEIDNIMVKDFVFHFFSWLFSLTHAKRTSFEVLRVEKNLSYNKPSFKLATSVQKYNIKIYHFKNVVIKFLLSVSLFCILPLNI